MVIIGQFVDYLVCQLILCRNSQTLPRKFDIFFRNMEMKCSNNDIFSSLIKQDDYETKRVLLDINRLS